MLKKSSREEGTAKKPQSGAEEGLHGKGLLRELKIGNITLAHNIVAGPMAGVSDLPFRLLCREQGAAMVCMEMASARAITYRNRKTDMLLEIHPAEHPVSLQLFGSDPGVLAQAVRLIAVKPYDILDINMGCPVPKVVGNGEGSALMKSPEQIERIVRAVTEATDRPVTVKLRKGYEEGHETAVECALAAEAGGASAVTVHGRSRAQYYAGRADWSCIARVKEALHIPVIGNGDVTDGERAAEMLAETGCDGVMIARAARGNPWIFREAQSFLLNGTVPARPTRREVGEMLLRHMELQCQHKGAYTAVREMRSHIAWYTAGFPHAARLREQVMKTEEKKALQDIVSHFFISPEA